MRTIFGALNALTYYIARAGDEPHFISGWVGIIARQFLPEISSGISRKYFSPYSIPLRC